MPDRKLVGVDYTTPDLVAKVTGRAKYAEDYRADGMLFVKLLLSPMPHARVRRIDTAAALAIPGVKAILTADDLPDLHGAERALTNEPLYQGEPILAVAAIDEATAAEAVEHITIDFDPLPFVVDPVESLRPNGANARLDGNVWFPAAGAPPAGGPPPRPTIQTLKWTDDDFAHAPDGGLPMGKAAEEWSFGDLDAGFRDAAIVVDETFVVQSTGHQPMETRSAMAYWQNGKLFLQGSTQSVARTVDPLASWLGIDASKIVLISEYTGGGFGSKGAGAVSMAVPAMLSKKTGTPVMMRISREEEHYIGRARTGMTGRARVGFAKDGRITALDLFIVEDNGAYGPMGDHRSAGNAASLIWQPAAMRWRGLAVITNTPPRSQQRSPGAVAFASASRPGNRVAPLRRARQSGRERIAKDELGGRRRTPAGLRGRRAADGGQHAGRVELLRRSGQLCSDRMADVDRGTNAALSGSGHAGFRRHRADR